MPRLRFGIVRRRAVRGATHVLERAVEIALALERIRGARVRGRAGLQLPHPIERLKGMRVIAKLHVTVAGGAVVPRIAWIDRDGAVGFGDRVAEPVLR